MTGAVLALVLHGRPVTNEWDALGLLVGLLAAVAMAATVLSSLFE